MLDYNKRRDVPSRSILLGVARLGRDDKRSVKTLDKCPLDLPGIHAGKAHAVESAGVGGESICQSPVTVRTS